MMLAALLPLIASTAIAAAPESAAIRRFALIVGMNDGGKKRVELRYATEDARRMATVLEELGGVSEGDRTMLLSADRAQLESALVLLRSQLAAAKRPGTLRQLIFYYSGHSDGEGLLLGSEHVKYGDLRKLLQNVGADIQIAILDSCASGALVRAKGGKPRPPFLLDESNQVRGHVYLTSSSEDEVAQESDKIGGSFFTHYLISGLRGAADTSHDGKVTLSEAYQFAFDQTLERTEQTTGGAQHASYDMQLAGSGDLVITDLRESAARLTFGAALEGRFYVRDGSGRLIAELYKTKGRPAELGLEPGKYQITQEAEDQIRAATVVVERGDTPDLAELTPVDPEEAVSRGDEKEAPYFPIGLSLIPQLSTSFSGHITTNFALDVLWGAYANVYGVQISSIVGQVDHDFEGAQIAGVVGIAGNLRGAQISGVLNWAGTMDAGAQIGVVNIVGDGRGVQIGLVNVAEHFEGLRLGLFNISKDTVYRASAWASETEPVQLAFKTQDKVMYTMLSAGARRFDKEGPWTFAYGLGAELQLGAGFYLDIDAVAMSVHPTRGFVPAKVVPVRARVMAGYRLFSRLAIFAGLAGTIAVEFEDPGGLDLYAPKFAKRLSDHVAVWPGFAVGIEI